MRIMIRPAIDQQREIDLTQRLIAAIAEELWQRYGGNEQLNWLEAEAHLKRLVGQVQVEAGVNVADQSVTGMGADEPTIALEPRRRREVSGLDNIASCARGAACTAARCIQRAGCGARRGSDGS